MYVPFPPVGFDPVKAEGVAPEQIACAVPIVLFARTGLTVISMEGEISLHVPEVAVLLYHVDTVRAAGA